MLHAGKMIANLIYTVLINLDHLKPDTVYLLLLFNENVNLYLLLLSIELTSHDYNHFPSSRNDYVAAYLYSFIAVAGTTSSSCIIISAP